MQVLRGGGKTKKANLLPDCDENKGSFLFLPSKAGNIRNQLHIFMAAKLSELLK